MFCFFLVILFHTEFIDCFLFQWISPLLYHYFVALSFSIFFGFFLVACQLVYMLPYHWRAFEIHLLFFFLFYFKFLLFLLFFISICFYEKKIFMFVRRERLELIIFKRMKALEAFASTNSAIFALLCFFFWTKFSTFTDALSSPYFVMGIDFYFSALRFCCSLCKEQHVSRKEQQKRSANRAILFCFVNSARVLLLQQLLSLFLSDTSTFCVLHMQRTTGKIL